jgi:hypothetical protein
MAHPRIRGQRAPELPARAQPAALGEARAARARAARAYVMLRSNYNALEPLRPLNTYRVSQWCALCGEYAASSHCALCDHQNVPELVQELVSQPAPERLAYVG